MFQSPLIISDEPTREDLLGRDVYARTLQKVAQNCQTPMVIGVHGDWGSGKTSLMQLTRNLLEKEGIRTVWFNPWVYQFDESPIIPLLNEIKKRAIFYRIKIEGLKLLSVLTSLAGEAILRLTTGGAVKSEYILKQGEAFEEKYFEVKTMTMNIHEHFQEVVNAIAGKDGRLVIFIDDLDRCLPPQSLKVLEAIKLFLNAEKCVYIVGMDREVIEQAIVSHYGELKLSGVSYLDKIIQLPFKLPPVTEEGVNKYLDRLKQDTEIESYYGIIRKGTGHNPRAIKRFINTFLFNHRLAQEIQIKNYRPYILIKLLILQLRYPDFYRYITLYKKEFSQVEKWALVPSLEEEERKKISPQVQKFLADAWFKEILREEPLIKEEDITPYIHLAETNIFVSPSISQIEKCPKCANPMDRIYIDTWEGDTDGNYPKYITKYVCSKCDYEIIVGESLD